MIEIFREFADQGWTCFDTLKQDGILEAWFTGADGSLIESTHLREIVWTTHNNTLPTDDEVKAIPKIAELKELGGDLFVWVVYHYDKGVPRTKRLAGRPQGPTKWGLLVARYPSRDADQL